MSIDSGAVRNPQLLAEGAKAFGSQCVVLSMQVKRVPKSDKIPSGFEIYIDGGRRPMGLDALQWRNAVWNWGRRNRGQQY